MGQIGPSFGPNLAPILFCAYQALPIRASGPMQFCRWIVVILQCLLIASLYFRAYVRNQSLLRFTRHCSRSISRTKRQPTGIASPGSTAWTDSLEDAIVNAQAR